MVLSIKSVDYKLARWGCPKMSDEMPTMPQNATESTKHLDDKIIHNLNVLIASVKIHQVLLFINVCTYTCMYTFEYVLSRS